VFCELSQFDGVMGQFQGVLKPRCFRSSFRWHVQETSGGIVLLHRQPLYCQQRICAEGIGRMLNAQKAANVWRYSQETRPGLVENLPFHEFSEWSRSLSSFLLQIQACVRLPCPF